MIAEERAIEIAKEVGQDSCFFDIDKFTRALNLAAAEVIKDIRDHYSDDADKKWITAWIDACLEKAK